MKRRSFIKNITQSGVALYAGPWLAGAMTAPETVKLTILHTNDVHSRLDPFPKDGSRNSGKGGAARRAALIKNIRAEEENVLLLDAGDIFQGTPYFNFFGGEIEMKVMSQMGYDAATIGNHDFDGGVDGLVSQLKHCSFPLLSANYDFSDTALNGQTQPVQIFDKGGLKIGVFGLGIKLDGLVPEELYKGTRYLDPLSAARDQASYLKNERKCDYVICLSHLGYKYRNENKPSDHILASQSTDIDMIIGGHTHTFLARPTLLNNRNDEPVIVNQVGWGGLYLGRIDVYFERSKKSTCEDCKNISIS